MPTTSRITSLLLACLLFLLSSTAPFTSTAHAADAPKKNTAQKLPNVLIIGDSISLGYTRHAAAALKSKARVIHHKGNAGPTMRGVKEIDNWLGESQWDVIHFNWGLWDMYGWRYEKIDRSPAAYEMRLETLVTRLKKTGATLIWATTTPICPEAEHNCKVKITPKLERAYLDAAARVMKKNNIKINDLHGFMTPKWKQYSINENDVHFNKQGYQALGKQVAKVMETVIESEK